MFKLLRKTMGKLFSYVSDISLFSEKQKTE